MIKQLLRTGTRHLVSKWRYLCTGCLAIIIPYINNYSSGEGENSEIAYEKFRTMKTNPVKINVQN
jgi:hypothetical protein